MKAADFLESFQTVRGDMERAGDGRERYAAALHATYEQLRQQLLADPWNSDLASRTQAARLDWTVAAATLAGHDSEARTVETMCTLYGAS